MKMIRKMVAWSLAAALLLSGLPVTMARATAVETEEVVSQVTVDAAELPDNGQLYDAYIESLFYGGMISFFGERAREQLDPLGRQLYDYLKEKIQKVAAGESSNTYFELEAAQFAAWGSTLEYSVSSAQNALAAFKQEFDVENVVSALLNDCPYELYWYDKVTGITTGASVSSTAAGYKIHSVKFRFAVVGDYQPSGYDEKYPTFNTALVTGASAAAANAKLIIAKHEASTDYEKLLAYKNEICSRVSYDSTVSAGSFSADADPWQLVYVFDGNSATNVVCEGYAKAFQYLCDLSEFQGTADCQTVTGSMVSNGKIEGHMWNIVTLEGQNYLADVTNSDYGTIGQSGGLFLAGGTGDISGGYTVLGTKYVYDNSTLALWGTGEDSILKLAGESYAPGACAEGHTEVIAPAVEASCTETGLTEGRHCSVCGTVIKTQEIVKKLEHSYEAVVTEPTCTTGGNTTQVCTVCGDSYVESRITALGHSYKDKWDTTCEVCGAKRDVKVETVPMYRLYNPNSGEHFYTGSIEERDNLVTAGWNYEGISWNAPVREGDPVHRMYNPNSGDHHYTMSQEEIDMLLEVGWEYEGICWNSAPVEVGVPLYRLYNPNADCGSHHYTGSEEERENLVDLGWLYEGISWYGIP